MEYKIKTTKAQEFVNITNITRQAVSSSGMEEGIYFCEFDGPRSRTIYIKTIKG